MLCSETNFFNCIGLFWILLSVISTVCVIIGYYMPYWIIGTIYINGHQNMVYFGPFRRCNYPIFNETTKQFEMENLCGRYSTFADIPSLYWQMCIISIGFGCILSITVTTFLILSYFKRVLTKSSSSLIGLLQVVSAIGVSSGCLIYPMGWDNVEVRDACGKKVNAFSIGECNIGWSYICILIGSALKLICGVLSICPIHTKRKPSTHYSMDTTYDIYTNNLLSNKNLCQKIYFEKIQYKNDVEPQSYPKTFKSFCALHI